MAVLARTPVLDVFDMEALRILAFSAERRRAAAGETLFRQGERSDGAYVVMSGAVAIGRDAPGQAERVLREASLIGRTAMFVRLQRASTAVAREDTDLMRISPTLIRRVLEEFPDAARAVRAALAADLETLMDGIAAVDATFAAIGRSTDRAARRE